ncbi:Thoeris anti-defense Tad2 family protein [Nonomuraea zeae]|uniref:Thoeris anti-defense Tad2 family protein n=1 Tax=Nonomuraea zeae TaxID=1642303 RepID=UPI00361FEA54
MAGRPEGEGGEEVKFGDALNALKAGRRLARAGWNGKGMWVFRVPARPSLSTRTTRSARPRPNSSAAP